MMRRTLSLLLGSVALALAVGLPARATAPTAPGPVLVPGQNDADWRALFETLAGEGAVRSAFTEERWFRFRTHPVILHGEMRSAPGHGLSLHYTDPEEQTMIVDEHGLVLRSAKGSRELPADPKAPRMDTVLLPVLRFDLPALLRFFILHAARDGADWRLDFEPRTPELARQLSGLTVYGQENRIVRLVFERAANQRVVVEIGHTDTHVTFSAEELKRFFR